MKQIINIQRMTCWSCVAKITELFKKHYNITDINIDKDSGKVEYEHDVFLTNSDITKMLEWTKYSMSDKMLSSPEIEAPITLSTYTPLFVLFGYIILFSLLVEYLQWSFDVMRFMQHFMGGFFISFSYFNKEVEQLVIFLCWNRVITWYILFHMICSFAYKPCNICSYVSKYCMSITKCDEEAKD